jgi:hypothetical protein
MSWVLLLKSALRLPVLFKIRGGSKVMVNVPSAFLVQKPGKTGLLHRMANRAAAGVAVTSLLKNLFFTPKELFVP